MCCFIFVVAIRTNEYTAHHSKRAKCCRNHITHYITIVVFTSPNETTLAADYASNSVVDKGVEILKTLLVELFLVVFLEYFLENFTETSIVFLRNGILCWEPNILIGVECKLEARVCEWTDRLICVVHTLNNAFSLEFLNNNFFFLTTSTFEHQLSCSWLVYTEFYTFIYIAISMTCNSDRLLPALHRWVNRRNSDRCAKYSTVKDRADSSVRALPHFV